MNKKLGSQDTSVADDPSFLAALDASPALMWLSDADFGGIYFNTTWREFTGRDLDRAVGGGWMADIHPDDIDGVHACKNALFERQPFQVEYRLRRHDGEWRWMLDSGRPHFGPDGAFQVFVGSCIDISDRKEAQEACARSEERLKLAQEAAAVGTYDWHVDEDELSWSPQMFRLYGIDPSTPPGQIYAAWLDRLHPDDRERADQETKEFVKSAEELAIEFRIIHPKEGERWIQGRGRMHRAPDGRPLRMSGVNFDVTEQRRAEENLRESEQRIRDIAENFPGIIFRRITYPDGRIEYPYFSGADETVFNVAPAKKGVPQTIEEISKHIHYDDLGEMLARLKKASETLTPLELEGRIVGENGALVAWIHSVSRPRQRADGALVWDGVILNVTERHQRRAERERAATMLRMSVEVAGVGTWEYDPSNKTVRGSRVMNELFGLPDDDAARPLAQYMKEIHPEDRPWVERGLVAGGETRQGTSREYRLLGKNGEVRWFSSVGTYVRLSDGTERVIGALSDVTSRKRHEEDREAHFRHQQDLLRQLNHRVKNNLQVVLSLMRMEARRTAAADGLARAIGKVETIADLHARLSFLAGSGQIDFGSYLKDLAEKLRDQLADGDRIVVNCNAESCMVELDRAVPLGLAVHELVTQSIARGSVERGTGTIRICLECGEAGAEVVAVSDDFAADPDASALNLNLVRGMCRQIGATLEQVEEPGVGYRIVLPYGSESP